MKLLSYFTPKTPWTMVYMLQQVEYNPQKFLMWALSGPNLFNVQKRGILHATARAKLMLLLAFGVWAATLLGGLLPAITQSKPELLLVSLLAPFTTLFMLFSATVVLQLFIINPTQNREIDAAKRNLASRSDLRIAVIGSYGKTTMKELLTTVLSQGKKVAATPGNKNVLVSHARWINRQLTGNEEVLVFEYGEGKPGDIASLASLSKPDIAIITGLAPAHLDEYSSLEAIADDFATIQKTVPPENTWLDSRSDLLKQKIKAQLYDEGGVGDWKVSEVSVGFEGTSFTMQNGERKLKLKTGLLGAHQIGPICTVVAIAAILGLSDEQIQDGVAKTVAFEHRMQARQLHGAWIIDDTYNGNIEGMRAGLELLKALPGKRKIYVTPGLVDQGVETEPVHIELGQLIAAARPDKIVLMKNSVTKYIQSGLSAGNFQGEVALETNPLEYYTNLEHFLASGDVVLLQNDWPDSYK